MRYDAVRAGVAYLMKNGSIGRCVVARQSTPKCFEFSIVFPHKRTDNVLPRDIVRAVDRHEVPPEYQAALFD